MKVSEVIGCLHNALPVLGYIPSWKLPKAKASPKIFDRPETFMKLVKGAQEIIVESNVKNRGKLHLEYRLTLCRPLQRPKWQLLHQSQSITTKLKNTKSLRKSRRPMNAMLTLATYI
jgi:hypothetical protein